MRNRNLIAGSLIVALNVGTTGLACAQQYYSPQTPPMVLVAQPPLVAQAPAQRPMGGGFIEYVFGGGGEAPRPYRAAPPQYIAPQGAPPAPFYGEPQQADPQNYASVGPLDPMLEQAPRPDMPIDPRYLRQEVAYNGREEPGTIVIDTPNYFLYLVQGNGRALRYGIGVGRPGFTWSGTHHVSNKKEWPDWVPPKEMLERQPYLPHFMPGGPNNPLGARAMYLGSTLYRIHGSNEPWTIGKNVSSGCIRMRNPDVMDLFDRVKVGAKVVVM